MSTIRFDHLFDNSTGLTLNTNLKDFTADPTDGGGGGASWTKHPSYAPVDTTQRFLGDGASPKRLYMPDIAPAVYYTNAACAGADYDADLIFDCVSTTDLIGAG